MKTLIAALIAGVLLIPGTASTAFAGPGDGYSGSVKVATKVQAPSNVKKGQKFRVRARLIVSSNGQPCKGRYLLKAVQVNGGDNVIKKTSKTGGGVHKFPLKLRSTGTWVLKIRFIPVDNSPCRGGHSTTRTVVG